jgi:hypothetical protein
VLGTDGDLPRIPEQGTEATPGEQLVAHDEPERQRQLKECEGIGESLVQGHNHILLGWIDVL